MTWAPQKLSAKMKTRPEDGSQFQRRMSSIVTGDEREATGNITVSALIVEIGLAVAALVGGYLLGHSPLASTEFSFRAIPLNAIASMWGLVAIGPMLAMLAVVERSHWGPVARLRRVVVELIVPLFSRTTIIELLLISLAAGVGEEMLFRGFVQDGLGQWLGDPYGNWIALVVASVIFGVCHWITPTYALLATLIGFYLGWLFIITDNLLTAIIAHAVYDFVALLYLVKWKPTRQNKKNGPIDDDRAAEP